MGCGIFLLFFSLLGSPLASCCVFLVYLVRAKHLEDL